MEQKGSGVLYLMCGLPGSGKTTAAKKVAKNDPRIKYVSRDDIRYTMVSDQEHYFDRENEVYREFCNQISRWLQQGNYVIADATHLTKNSRKKLLNNIIKPAQIRCIFVNTPFDICMERNSKRKGITRVPDKQMYRMKNTLQIPSAIEGFDMIFTI
jgi:predicted kinase